VESRSGLASTTGEVDGRDEWAGAILDAEDELDVCDEGLLLTRFCGIAMFT